MIIIQFIKKYNIIKKGTIVVRLTECEPNASRYEQHTGALVQSIKDGNNAKYTLGLSIAPKAFRLATPKEIQAYKNGCRNINDIEKYLNSDNYEIF